MSKGGTTISIRPYPDRPARKVTKIVPYSEGGFSVITPYHSARQGFLAKFPVDYAKAGPYTVTLDELVGFTADDRVKLSYHADGFAQFSSERPGAITSGRDPSTGEPKGIGLMTSPLSDPIRTGPSTGLTIWGLEDFDELGDRNTGIVFSHDDMYFRGCTPETASAWIVEIFVFHERYWAGVRQRGEGYSLSMSFRDFEASGTVIDFAVVPLPGQPCFLAAFASRIRGEFPTGSGWILGGPGKRDPRTDRGHVLKAFYPRDVFMEARATSLDRPKT